MRDGLLPASYLDNAVANALTLRTRLGLFDPPTLVPYNLISNDTVLSPSHVALCRELASESTVLLQVRPPPSLGLRTPLQAPVCYAPAQNKKNVLPLSTAAYRKVALLGPAIDNGAVMLGDYADMAAPAVSIAAAALSALPAGVDIAVSRGCLTNACSNTSGFAAAEAAAHGANVAVLQLGLCSTACKHEFNPNKEGEVSGASCLESAGTPNCSHQTSV